ncbi:General control protein [Wickerhamomyces ciferrii]|uniref:General control protein n=1 Tax=Wickerhamomyces ciferrii (strain ATCC 14091 / BCRC 22168 / CBS 111 / JCM 3599 / NBRC 0793 / NRRL Y-1031 F-60-10) TaxID=1206466 RepID=K0KP45_WICCF|nr:General control protein [Wickerhamomyces ciferrii]CCH43159.1 General control protein [Wickerhamomyces ciferrii]
MNNIESTSTLFEMFESMEFNQSSVAMYQSNMLSSSAPDSGVDSKPRQILGESVFNQFIKTQELNSEFPLGLEKIEIPELSPSIGTITPLQLHSSVVESIFDPIMENQSPMFDEVELDSENWNSLFEPNELEIKQEETTPEPKQVSSHLIDEVASKPIMKRSSSEAELELPSTKKSSPSPKPQPQSTPSTSNTDHLGVVSYNRKQRSIPLSPIQIDESLDPISQKRARNTEAARRSRARKMERMNQLEDKVEILVSKNSQLENEVLRLRSLLQQSGQSF